MKQKLLNLKKNQELHHGYEEDETNEAELFDVVIKSVDNYQGEENDIIHLSTVRSNKKRDVGFLKCKNRICVALSRVRLGFIAIGNFTQLAGKNKLWKTITDQLCRLQLLGDALNLLCPNSHHPHQQIAQVKSDSDLDKRPTVDGGCSLPCNVPMQCGHMCMRKCHADDPKHAFEYCKEPCTKILCEREHLCPKECGDNCDKCFISVKKVVSRCGHVRDMPCHENPKVCKCEEHSKSILSCGHKCRQFCYEICDDSKCKELVKVMIQCSHEIQALCPDYIANKVVCTVKCDAMLECDHKCKGT